MSRSGAPVLGVPVGYPRAGEVYCIVPRHAPNKALAVKGDETRNGAELVLWEREGRASQLWRVDTRSGDTFCFVPLHAPDKKLDANNGVSHNCHLWDVSNPYNENQVFRLQPTAGDFFLILRCCDGAVIDVEHQGTYNGANIHTWGKITGNSNQQWCFVPAMAQGSREPQAPPHSPLQQVGAVALQVLLHAAQTFEEERSRTVAPEKVAKKSPGHHVGNSQAPPGIDQPRHPAKSRGQQQPPPYGQRQGCQLENGGLYQISPRSAQDKVVGVQSNYTENRSALVIWEPDGLPNQTWRAHDRGGGCWSFAPMHAQDKRLDANNGVGQHCHIWDCKDPNNENQIWSVEPTDHGFFRILRAKDRKPLEVAKYDTNKGAVVLHTWNRISNIPNQQFAFSRVG